MLLLRVPESHEGCEKNSEKSVHEHSHEVRGHRDEHMYTARHFSS